MSNDNNIPQEIQDWIDKDIELLRNGKKEEIEKYIEWFNHPSRDTELNHQISIQQVIDELGPLYE